MASHDRPRLPAWHMMDGWICWTLLQQLGLFYRHLCQYTLPVDSPREVYNASHLLFGLLESWLSQSEFTITMPKVKQKSGRAAEKLIKDKNRPIHPYSRKALQLGKQLIHGKRLEAARSTQAMRTELLAEKLRWFQNHLDDRHVYTKQDVIDLIMQYRGRFSEELEQIDIIQSVGNRKGLNQHASRESSIKITVEEETNQFDSSGIEVPDLINKKHLEDFKKWNGEIKFIQNLKLRKISFRDVERLDQKKNLPDELSSVSEVTKCDVESEIE